MNVTKIAFVPRFDLENHPMMLYIRVNKPQRAEELSILVQTDAEGEVSKTDLIRALHAFADKIEGNF